MNYEVVTTNGCCLMVLLSSIKQQLKKKNSKTLERMFDFPRLPMLINLLFMCSCYENLFCVQDLGTDFSLRLASYELFIIIIQISLYNQ